MVAGDHLLELAQGVGAVAGVTRVGREEADRVVAPIVPQALLKQIAVIEEGVDRQQLDGRHAQGLDVVDHRLLPHAGIGAAQSFGNGRVELGETLDVRLIDEGLLPRREGRPGCAAPVEIGVDHHAFGHEGRAVPLVEAQVLVLGADGVAIAGVVPLDLAGVTQSIGIQQQLVGIEPVAGLWLVGAIDAIAIDLPWLDAFHIAVEDLVGVVWQGDALDLLAPLGVEQAQFDPRRVGGEQGEVHAPAIEAGPKRVVRSGPHGETGRHATSLMHGVGMSMVNDPALQLLRLEKI